MISMGGGAYTTENKELSVVDYLGGVSVAPGNSIMFLAVTPPAGERWDILFLGLNIDGVGGASGSHQVELRLTSSADGYYVPVFVAGSVHDSDILIENNCYITADHYKSPPLNSGLMNNFRGLFIDALHPLHFRYTNNTNVAQTGYGTVRMAFQISKF